MRRMICSCLMLSLLAAVPARAQRVAPEWGSVDARLESPQVRVRVGRGSSIEALS